MKKNLSNAFRFLVLFQISTIALERDRIFFLRGCDLFKYLANILQKVGKDAARMVIAKRIKSIFN